MIVSAKRLWLIFAIVMFGNMVGGWIYGTEADLLLRDTLSFIQFCVVAHIMALIWGKESDQ